MKHFRRVFLPLLLAFSLLFAQQVGAMHTLRHALEEQVQHGKQTPHSVACEQCAAYSQLGNALSGGVYEFTPPLVPTVIIQQRSLAFHPIQILAAVARGPPGFLQTDA